MLLDIKFETNTLNDPKNDLENYKVNATPYLYYKYPPESETLNPSMARRFELQISLRQVHRMTQNDLEHYQVKGTPYMLY